jgi:tetratricopeptide (TPR) repeat protein
MKSRRKSFLRLSPAWALLLLVMIGGCAETPLRKASSLKPLSAGEFTRTFVEKQRNRGLEYEQKKDWPQALRSWEIVLSFLPADEAVRKKVEELRQQITALSNQHFRKGVAHFQKNALIPARKEFLAALYYDPSHKEARLYLKEKIPGEEYTPYEVKKGETLKEIARKKYGDPQKDFIIAYFNDLGLNARPAPKTILKIPLLDQLKVKEKMEMEEDYPEPPERPLTGPEELLATAQGHLTARRYKESIVAAEKILETDPTNKEARGLISQACYQNGKALIQARKFSEALTALNRVDPGYRDIKETILSVKKQLAEAHYLQGVKFYTDQELEKAIQEWETTLAYDPGHTKARRDIENARGLLQRLKEIK